MKPVIFLDFDRTLFDTDQFYDWLGSDRFGRILALIAGRIDPPDFSSYLYPDTRDFLTAIRRSHRVVLLTFAQNTILQKRKLQGSGVIPLCDDVIITIGGKDGSTGKGEAARAYLARIGDPGWEHLFVDDAPENIDEMKRANPDIRTVRIDRKPDAHGSLTGGFLPPDLIVTNLRELLVEL